MKRPLLGIFMIWILGEVLAIGLGLSLVPATSLDRAMADRESASVTVYGKVCRFRRTSSGFSYELADCRVDLSGDLLTTHHLLVFTDDIHDLKIGYEVEVTGDLSLFDVPTNPGQFDMRAYYRALGIDYSVWEERVEVENRHFHRILQALWEVRESMREILLELAPQEEAGIFLSIFLGDRSSMDGDVRTMYQNGGIGHILAISGLHISLFGMALYRFLKRVGCPLAGNLLISSSFMAAYVWMTGGSASSVRAWIMFCVFLLAGVVGRSYDILSALSLAGILLLADHPLLLFQSGFQLSFLAMVGVSLVYPLWESWWVLRRRFAEESSSCSTGQKEEDMGWRKIMSLPWIQGLMKGAAFSLAIQTVTLPVIARSYYSIPIYSVILNLIVLPLTGLLLGTVAACAALSELAVAALGIVPAMPFLPDFLLHIRDFLILVARAVLLWYELLCHRMEALPWSTKITGKPAGWQILLYVLLFLTGQACICRDRNRLENIKRQERIQKIHGRNKGKGREYTLPRGLKNPLGEWLPTEVTALIEDWILKIPWRQAIPLWFLSLFLLLCHPPNRQFRITALDVGQGDCICIQIPGSAACLVDGGSSSVRQVGTYRILPFLKSQGIGHLGAVFVTHGDGDHYSGLTEVLEDTTMKVDALCMTEAALEDPELEELRSIADRRHIPIRCLHPMDRWQWGKAEFLCLYPSKEACSNWEEDKNNTSLVLKLRVGAFSGVFTGDLAEEGEEELLGDPQLREEVEDVDLLKVGHHGSRFSSCQEFLQTLKPKMAIISCGKKNRYGHPHPEVVERLQEAGSQIYRTDEGGAIAVVVKSDGRALYYSRKL